MNIFTGFAAFAAVSLAMSFGALAAEPTPAQMNPVDTAIYARMPQLLADGATQILGNKNGDVTIIEFFDYQCPFSRRVQDRLADFVRADGNVKLVVKNFPVIGPGSRVAARAAQAAARQDKFEPLHAALFTYKEAFTKDSILVLAQKLGIDTAALSRDMDTPEVSDAVTVNFDQARQIKVTSTPGFIINGHFVTEASADIDFPKIIAAARAQNSAENAKAATNRK